MYRVRISISESYLSPRFRLGCLFLAVLRRGAGFKRTEKPHRDGRYFVNRGLKRSLIGFRRLVESGDLTDELQRSGADFILRDRGIKIEESFDVATHELNPYV